jgi:hypothetical protein
MRRYLALQLSSSKDSCYWVDELIVGYAQGENRIGELTTTIVHLEILRKASMTNRCQ